MKNYLKEQFKEYNVPKHLQQATSEIVLKYNINGLTDPIYITNVIANELGHGDGNTNFNSNTKVNPKKLKHIATRLEGSYGSKQVNKDEVEDILIRTLL